MYVIFGAYNARSLDRTGVLGLMTSEVENYRMDPVGAQEVRWESSGALPSGNCTLFYGEGNANHQLETRFSVRRRIGSAVKRVKIVSDRIYCIKLKRRWCDIVV